MGAVMGAVEFRASPAHQRKKEEERSKDVHRVIRTSNDYFELRSAITLSVSIGDKNRNAEVPRTQNKFLFSLGRNTYRNISSWKGIAGPVVAGHGHVEVRGTRRRRATKENVAHKLGGLLHNLT
jgi:hypothetical protein